MTTVIAEREAVVVTIDNPSAVVTTSRDTTAIEVVTTNTVNSSVENTIVTNTPEYLVVRSEGSQGPKGIPGDSTTTITLVAGTDLSGHRAVSLNSVGDVIYADKDTPSTADRLLGITTSSALNGMPVEIQIASVLIEPSWSWDVSKVLYVGNLGQLTQEVPTTGYVYSIAVPATPTKIFISKQPPIIIG